MSNQSQQQLQYLSKVLAMYKSGMNTPEISRIIGVTRRTVERWIDSSGLKRTESSQKFRLRGSYAENRAKYYDEVIRLHFEKGYGADKIEQLLPVGHTTASRWIANFVAENGNQYAPAMKERSKEASNQSECKSSDVRELQAEIARLQKQLDWQTMRADAYDLMIDLAEKKFQIPIRKKSGAKQ